MAGFHDEDKFDAFAEKLTLDGLAGKITCPYLSVAGEDDDLSPIEHTYRLHEGMRAPNTLVVYKGERHGVTDNMDVRAFIADWMKDRFDGKPLQTRRIIKDCRTGQEIKQQIK
jgi:pimeloyl-ACP methyl ester carboxylesterase